MSDHAPSSPKRLARLAGVLYLVVGVGSGFPELYVRAGARVPGDAAATAANVAGKATLFRAGFAGDLVGITAFLLVAMALYHLLRHVDARVAAAMVTFVAVAVAIMSINMINHFAALRVATDGSYAATFGADGSDLLVLTFLDLHATGFTIAEIFFGLWLLPLGYLALRSGYFPRPLAILLMVGSFGYVANSLLHASFDDLGGVLPYLIVAPAAVAEFWLVGYLLVRGIRTSEAPVAAPVAS